MLVRDAMTRGVVTARVDTPLADLVDLMIENDVTGVPVLDLDGTVIGVVTEADLVARQGFGGEPRHRLSAFQDLFHGRRNRWWQKAAAMTTGEVMSTPARTITATVPLRAAAARMLTLGVKRLPVVDDAGRLVGIVSRRDLLRLFHRTDEAIATDVRATLADPLRGPENHGVQLVSVTRGIVHLTGWVHTDADAELIEAVVRQLPGVIDVRTGIGRRRLVGTVTGPGSW